MSVTHAISGESIEVNKATVNTVETVAVASPSGTVHVNGELSLGAVSTNGTVSASSFIQEDVVQWALKFHEDFEGEVQGWSSKSKVAVMATTTILLAIATTWRER
jgi:hypothetical protein